MSGSWKSGDCSTSQPVQAMNSGTSLLTCKRLPGAICSASMDRNGGDISLRCWCLRFHHGSGNSTCTAARDRLVQSLGKANRTSSSQNQTLASFCLATRTRARRTAAVKTSTPRKRVSGSWRARFRMKSARAGPIFQLDGSGSSPALQKLGGGFRFRCVKHQGTNEPLTFGPCGLKRFGWPQARIAAQQALAALPIPQDASMVFRGQGFPREVHAPLAERRVPGVHRGWPGTVSVHRRCSEYGGFPPLPHPHLQATPATGWPACFPLPPGLRGDSPP